jgi:hypothetical protein
MLLMTFCLTKAFQKLTGSNAHPHLKHRLQPFPGPVSLDRLLQPSSGPMSLRHLLQPVLDSISMSHHPLPMPDHGQLFLSVPFHKGDPGRPRRRLRLRTAVVPLRLLPPVRLHHHSDMLPSCPELSQLQETLAFREAALCSSMPLPRAPAECQHSLTSPLQAHWSVI